MQAEIDPEDEMDLRVIPAFLTNTEDLNIIKKYVSYSAISLQQKWFIHLIYQEKCSRAKVQEIWLSVYNEQISKDALKTCALRTAFSRWWKKGSLRNGNTDYLVEEDLEILKKEIAERAALHNALDTVSVLDEAQKLKVERYNKAIEFLRLIRSEKLANKLEDVVIQKPSRSWINTIIQYLEARLDKPRLIDGRRFLAVSYESIRNYFEQFGSFIQSFNKLCIITADETMMQSNASLKVLVPKSMPTYVDEKPPDMPHITSMCCCTIVGTAPPLFIIIKDRQTPPKELKDLIDSGQIALISTTTGWMDRWAFLLWCFHFISYLVSYRQNLPSNLQDSPFLLILDGHTSRENPIALEYLKAYNVEVLILPGHCTHVLQLFDVALAAALKEKFGIILRRNLKDKRMYTQSVMSENIRKIYVESFLESWSCVCNKGNCESGARITGIYPMNPEAPKETGFLKDLTPEERARQDAIDARKRNRLDINASIVTSPEKIEEIRETVKKSDDVDLCKRMSDFENAEEFFRFYFAKAKEKGAVMLSKPMPCAGWNIAQYCP